MTEVMHLKGIKGRGKHDYTTGQWQVVCSVFEIKMYNLGCSYSTNSDVNRDAKLAAISDNCFLSCHLSAIALFLCNKTIQVKAPNGTLPKSVRFIYLFASFQLLYHLSPLLWFLTAASHCFATAKKAGDWLLNSMTS